MLTCQNRLVLVFASFVVRSIRHRPQQEQATVAAVAFCFCAHQLQGWIWKSKLVSSKFAKIMWQYLLPFILYICKRKTRRRDSSLFALLLLFVNIKVSKQNYHVFWSMCANCIDAIHVIIYGLHRVHKFLRCSTMTTTTVMMMMMINRKIKLDSPEYIHSVIEHGYFNSCHLVRGWIWIQAYFISVSTSLSPSLAKCLKEKPKPQSKSMMFNLSAHSWSKPKF